MHGRRSAAAGASLALKRLHLPLRLTSTDETVSVRAAELDRNAPTLGCLQAETSSCQSDCSSPAARTVSVFIYAPVPALFSLFASAGGGGYN